MPKKSEGKWSYFNDAKITRHESLFYYKHVEENIEGKCINLAGFDMDSTLILSTKGEKYCKDSTSWIWAFDSVPEKLKALREAGYTLVIFTNRTMYPQAKEAFKGLIDNIFKALGFKFFVFTATRKAFKKGNTTMFEVFKAVSGAIVNHETSFYTGDAVGEKSCVTWHKWSDEDFMFAKNCYLKFYEPTEIFCNREYPMTSLIITTGHMTSGISFFESQNPVENSLTNEKDFKSITVNGKLYTIIKTKDFMELKCVDEKTNYLIYGVNETDEIRNQIIKKAGRQDAVIHFYARSNDPKDKLYQETFQMPIGNNVFRIN